MKYPRIDYFIPGRQNIVPAAIHISAGAHEKPILTNEFRRPNWVIDYYPGNGILYSAGTMSDFRSRPSSCIHLYPPATRYQEDFRHCSMPQPCCWMIFRGGEELQLDMLCRNPYGFAEILDPQGKFRKIIMEGLSQAQAAGENGFFEAQATLYRVIGLLTGLRPERECYQHGWENHSETAGEWLKQAQNLVRRNMRLPLDIAALARQMNCSVSSFSHKYRHLAGESPGQTLQTLRIDAAKVLLDNNNSVKEVAASTGFYDEFHFSRVFKRHTGLSPSEFRNRSLRSCSKITVILDKVENLK